MTRVGRRNASFFNHKLSQSISRRWTKRSPGVQPAVTASKTLHFSKGRAFRFWGIWTKKQF
jgi:hypothetical protein